MSKTVFLLKVFKSASLLWIEEYKMFCSDPGAVGAGGAGAGAGSIRCRQSRDRRLQKVTKLPGDPESGLSSQVSAGKLELFSFYADPVPGQNK